jgi:hypothetical protein
LRYGGGILPFMPGGSGPGGAGHFAQHDFFARDTANDRFYIRMYDGSTPPNYSEFSTALFINLPLGRERDLP